MRSKHLLNPLHWRSNCAPTIPTLPWTIWSASIPNSTFTGPVTLLFLWVYCLPWFHQVDTLCRSFLLRRVACVLFSWPGRWVTSILSRLISMLSRRSRTIYFEIVMSDALGYNSFIGSKLPRRWKSRVRKRGDSRVNSDFCCVIRDCNSNVFFTTHS